MTGFLQLLFTPRNVKVTPVERTALRVGEQLALTEAGRSFGSEAELRISPSKLARVHGRVTFREGRWRLSHHAEDLRTWVNGSPQAEAVLQHLDVLELPDFGPVFRFLTAPIAEGPTAQVALDDASRLAVWADALLEANDPLGDRLARLLRDDPFRTRQAVEDLRWLGPLARTLIDGRLEVQWRHGMLRRAVLRDLAPLGAEPLTSLDQLLRLPVARFLEELTIDAGGAEGNATAFVDVLKFVGGPASLRSLNFGEVSFADAWAEPAEARYQQELKRIFPALRTGPLFGRFRRAFLTVERAGSKAGEEPGDVQELGDSAELIDIAPPARGLMGPIGVAFWRLQRQQAHWELEAVPPSPSGIKLNGKPVFRAALRDGDQIELSTGVAYRFRLER